MNKKEKAIKTIITTLFIVFIGLVIWKPMLIDLLALLPIIPVGIKYVLERRKAELNKNWDKN